MLLAGFTPPFKLTLPEVNQVLKTDAVMVELQSLLASVGSVSSVNVMEHPAAIMSSKVETTMNFFEILNFFMALGFI